MAAAGRTDHAASGAARAAQDYTAKLAPAARDELRARAVAGLPSWYDPWLHLAFPSLVGLGLIAAALAVIHDLAPLELLMVPAVFLVSSANEWHAHKSLLHRRRWFAPVLYDRHTPLHHRVFLTEDMEVRSPREFGLVLIPAYGILLIFLGTCPVTVALWLAGRHNLAALFVATSMAYVVSYEWLHLSYHLPTGSFVGRLWLVRRLRGHHATHHDPALMQQWNFNVTVPLWDWVRGTIYRGPGSRGG